MPNPIAANNTTNPNAALNDNNATPKTGLAGMPKNIFQEIYKHIPPIAQARLKATSKDIKQSIPEIDAKPNTIKTSLLELDRESARNRLINAVNSNAEKWPFELVIEQRQSRSGQTITIPHNILSHGIKTISFVVNDKANLKYSIENILNAFPNAQELKILDGTTAIRINLSTQEDGVLLKDAKFNPERLAKLQKVDLSGIKLNNAAEFLNHVSEHCNNLTSLSIRTRNISTSPNSTYTPLTFDDVEQFAEKMAQHGKLNELKLDCGPKDDKAEKLVTALGPVLDQLKGLELITSKPWSAHTSAQQTEKPRESQNRTLKLLAGCASNLEKFHIELGNSKTNGQAEIIQKDTVKVFIRNHPKLQQLSFGLSANLPEDLKNDIVQLMENNLKEAGLNRAKVQVIKDFGITVFEVIHPKP